MLMVEWLPFDQWIFKGVTEIGKITIFSQLWLNGEKKQKSVSNWNWNLYEIFLKYFFLLGIVEGDMLNTRTIWNNNIKLLH